MTERSWRRQALACVLLLGAAACSSKEPEVARGEAVFKTCIPCHGENGGGNQTLGAPAIAGLPQWHIQAQLESFQKGWRGSHPMDTVGIRMKSMANTLRIEGDLLWVSQYVAAMPPVPQPATLEGDPTLGQQEFSLCGSCHGQDGKGMEATKYPPLAGQSDWYLLAQYRKFLDGRRGAHPDDLNGRTMASTARTRPLETVANVFAYIRTLQ